MGIPPANLGVWGSRKPLRAVRGRTPAENKFGAFPAFTTSLSSCFNFLLYYAEIVENIPKKNLRISLIGGAYAPYTVRTLCVYATGYW